MRTALLSLTQEPLTTPTRTRRRINSPNLFDKYNLLTPSRDDEDNKLTGVFISDDVTASCEPSLDEFGFQVCAKSPCSGGAAPGALLDLF